MRPLLSLLSAAILSAGVCACGGSGGHTSSASSTSSNATATVATTTVKASDLAPAPVLAKADADKDNDLGAPYDDTNNNRTLDFGHAASATDTRAIVSLIKHYYALALAGNGAEACSLLYSTVAEGAPEDYGTSPPGPPYMRGATCPVVVLGLFKHFHNQLAAEVPSLRVPRVRLVEHHGFAILSFGGMPERRFGVEREGHVWKVETLFDSELP